MKEEKTDTLTCHTCVHKSHGNLLITVGIIALVYGVVNYLRITVGYAWPSYIGWVLGGVILIVFGWVKSHLIRKCC